MFSIDVRDFTEMLDIFQIAFEPKNRFDYAHEPKPDIWAQTFGCETFGREDIWAQRHVGARHLGAKCVLAHFQQSFSTSSKNNFYKNFLFSTVLVF